MPDARTDKERLERLEEAAAFADRTTDQSHEEIRELGRRLDLAVRRLTALEQKIRREETDPPDAAPE